MKTILLINNTASSVLGFRKHLISHLIENNYTVYVAASDYTVLTKNSVEQLGAKVIDFPLKRTGTNPIADLKTLFHLWRNIRKIKPDVVFSFFTKPVIYGTIVAYLCKTPKIFAMIEGLGYAFTPLPEGDNLKRRVIRFILIMLYKIILPKTTKTFFLNHDDPYDLLKKNHIKSEYTIINGIGLNLKEYPFSVAVNQPISFIFVGRLLKEKGVIEFLQAAKNVKKTHPQTLFYVVGGFDFENPGSITSNDLKPYIDNHIITYIGYTSNVRQYIEKCSVFVLPSYYREGLPRSTQEAMAIGRAIITTDTPGCKETVEQGVNGFAVPKWNINALQEKMEYFIHHPDKIITMGENSYKIAQKKYDGDIINKQILEIIQNYE